MDPFQSVRILLQQSNNFPSGIYKLIEAVCQIQLLQKEGGSHPARATQLTALENDLQDILSEKIFVHFDKTKNAMMELHVLSILNSSLTKCAQTEMYFLFMHGGHANSARWRCLSRLASLAISMENTELLDKVCSLFILTIPTEPLREMRKTVIEMVLADFYSDLGSPHPQFLSIPQTSPALVCAILYVLPHSSFKADISLATLIAKWLFSSPSIFSKSPSSTSGSSTSGKKSPNRILVHNAVLSLLVWTLDLCSQKSFTEVPAASSPLSSPSGTNRSTACSSSSDKPNGESVQPTGRPADCGSVSDGSTDCRKSPGSLLQKLHLGTLQAFKAVCPTSSGADAFLDRSHLRHHRGEESKGGMSVNGEMMRLWRRKTKQAVDSKFGINMYARYVLLAQAAGILRLSSEEAANLLSDHKHMLPKSRLLRVILQAPH